MLSTSVSFERRVGRTALPCATALGLVLGLASCAVGPDFKSPEAPKANGYTVEALKPETGAANIHGGEAQRFVSALDIPGQWWSLYRSEALNGLIVQAIENSPTLDAAKAALVQAHENAAAARGGFFPAPSSVRRNAVRCCSAQPRRSSTFLIRSTFSAVSAAKSRPPRRTRIMSAMSSLRPISR
jgi:hypothetical protein